MSDLKLEVGKKYWTRNGRIRSIISHADIGDAYPWGHIDADGNEIWCSDNGRVFDDGEDYHLDLVRELTDQELLTEQTIETFAAITRNGGKVPDGMKRQCRSKVIDEPFVDVMELDILHTCLHYRLVPIEPPAPEMVPLSADDIPPGSVVRLAEGGWLNIAEVTDDGITVNSIAPDHISYADLKGDEWQILRPGQTWTRCEKPKP